MIPWMVHARSCPLQHVTSFPTGVASSHGCGALSPGLALVGCRGLQSQGVKSTVFNRNGTSVVSAMSVHIRFIRGLRDSSVTGSGFHCTVLLWDGLQTPTNLPATFIKDE